MSDKLHALLIEDPEVLKYRSQTIDDYSHNLSFLQPAGYILTDNYLNYHEKVKDFEVFEDDVWIATYPKCGMKTKLFSLTSIYSIYDIMYCVLIIAKSFLQFNSIL